MNGILLTLWVAQSPGEGAAWVLRPGGLVIGLALLAVSFFAARLTRRRAHLLRSEWVEAAAPDDAAKVPPPAGRPTRFAAGAGIVAVGLAAAGPVIGVRSQPRAASDLVLWIGLDVSASMGIAEGGISRLDAGRRVARDVLASVPGAQVGLAVFGSTGHAVLPPTRDPVVVEPFLSAVSPGDLSNPGTAIHGIEDLVALAGQSDGEAHLLLVSDGEWAGADGADGVVQNRGDVEREPSRADPEFSDAVRIHMIWTDSPVEGIVPGEVGRSMAVAEPGRHLTAESGGLFLPVYEPGAAARLSETLNRRAGANRTSGTESIPADGTAPVAGLAAVLLLLGAIRRRETS